MATLRFEIDTDANYTADELQEVQDAFTTFLTEIDPDADADTSDAKFLKPGQGTSINAEAVAEFIKQGGEVEYQVQVRLKDSDGTTGSAVTSYGNLS